MVLAFEQCGRTWTRRNETSHLQFKGTLGVCKEFCKLVEYDL